jgi:hypothetical protein
MIWIILSILFIHFIADFVLQTDFQAKNKSTSNVQLSLHVLTYTIGLMIGGFLLGNTALNVVEWCGINMILHWITDYFTSRLNSYLWKKQQVHWFFVSVGFDQFIHYTCLLLTYNKIIGF